MGTEGKKKNKPKKIRTAKKADMAAVCKFAAFCWGRSGFGPQISYGVSGIYLARNVRTLEIRRGSEIPVFIT